jgi:hypothetical protein
MALIEERVSTGWAGIRINIRTCPSVLSLIGSPHRLAPPATSVYKVGRKSKANGPFSRMTEYHADRVGASLAGSDAMVNALMKIEIANQCLLKVQRIISGEDRSKSFRVGFATYKSKDASDYYRLTGVQKKSPTNIKKIIKKLKKRARFKN